VRLALEQARDNEAEVDAILTPAQHRRLRQLALQSEGSGAFREPEVIDALRLTPAQREQIRAIEEEFRFSQMRELGSGPLSGEATKPRAMRAIQGMDGILRVLTGEQLRRWREMAGEPIRGTLRAFPMPFSAPRDPNRPPG
jgi:hypothetical protein